MTISYADPNYVSEHIEVIKIDLSQARSLLTTNTKIKAKFFEPSSRVTGMGGTLKASITNKVEFEVDGDYLNINSSSMMKGMYDYVIPMIDRDSFHCRVLKVQ